MARTSLPPAQTVGGQEFVARCEAIRAEVVHLLGPDRVRSDDASRLLHSYDASLESGSPDLVVAPRNSDELRALISAAYRHGVPFVMRGAGTGYSGGALPAHGGMVVLTAGLDRILEVDFDEGWIRCEPGVVLAEVQRRAAAAGWRYLPDPSSYQVCTIGGNVAENAGGPHALGAGPTSHHVIAVEVIRPNGDPVVLHEQDPWDGGLDLRALMIGSEGTLGAISSATLRLVRAPEMERVVVATFTRQEDAVATVAAAFDTGLLPSAMDMLTGAFIPDRPALADPSLLFVGLQGYQGEVADQAERLAGHIRDHDGHFDLLDLTAFLQRRAELVREKVRRMVAASGCPRYYLFDAVAPRSRLAELMDAIRQAATEFELPVLNTFHAGDGNVHPTPFYGPDDPDHRARLSGFSTQVLRECQRMGGSLSGEHGIGIEKRELMAEFYPREVLELMRAVKRAADPENLSNPGKVIPPVGAPSAATDSPVRRSTPGRCRVNLIDALVEIDDATVTFADVEAQLAGTPYELTYEPLGGTPDQSVLAAIDLGLPALREPIPARPRDLILGAELRRANAGPAIALGGRCAKDVAGYELRKLVYGGRGRLGMLSAARLRLLPWPTDSRLIHGVAMNSDAAVTLCRRLSTLALPFRYLGILITADGAATVTGRLELTGGVLDRHLDILHGETSEVPWKVLTGSRWLDPVMKALANPSTALVGAPHVLTHRAGRLARLSNHGRTVFISTGHGRTWWRGQPHASGASDGWLVDGVVGSFEAVHR